MASAMRALRKFRSSDGRIKVATLSGVSALVAVIALLVGVLPVFATDDSFDETDNGVHPEEVQYGGGSGACDFVDVDSDAGFELHINNPVSGIFTGPDGTRVEITLDEEDPSIFGYDFVGDPAAMAAYDVVVNGGAHNLWYDNDGQVGALQSDGYLHGPRKNNGDIYNLSHINICYDVQSVDFVCDTPEELEGEGLITNVTAEIFTNSVEGTFDCTDSKEAFYFIDNDTVTLDFGADGEPKVAGRLDFTKDFGDPTGVDPLEYDRDDTGTFLEVQWCDVRDEATGDGAQFDIELGSETRYPSLVGVKDTDGKSATACKVFEDLNAEGIQHTVVYFEFVDPQFR